jgi:lysophospholipase L1-like esterase
MIWYNRPMYWLLPTAAWPMFNFLSGVSGSAAGHFVQVMSLLSFLCGPALAPYQTVPPVIVFDGNSLTVGYTVSGEATYPAQCQALLSGNVVAINKRQKGLTTTDMTYRAPSTIDSFYGHLRTRNMVVAWEGSNDLSHTTVSAIGALDHLRTYETARRAAGRAVVLLSVQPRSVDAFGTPANFEASRQQLNSAMRAERSWVDGFVDVGADLVIGQANDDENSVYYAVGVHLTQAGYSIVARAVAAELLNMKVVDAGRP